MLNLLVEVIADINGTNLRDMKMGQTCEANEGQTFVDGKEDMRGKIIDREKSEQFVCHRFS